MYNCILVKRFQDLDVIVDNEILIKVISNRKNYFYISLKGGRKIELDDMFCDFLENNSNVKVLTMNVMNQQSTGWYLTALCEGKVSDKVVEP